MTDLLRVTDIQSVDYLYHIFKTYRDLRNEFAVVR